MACVHIPRQTGSDPDDVICNYALYGMESNGHGKPSGRNDSLATQKALKFGFNCEGS